MAGGTPAWEEEMADGQAKAGDLTGVTRLGARNIPLPRSISPEAQRLLAAGLSRFQSEPFPAADAPSAVWKERIAHMDAATLERLKALDAVPGIADSIERLGDLPLYVAEPDGAASDACVLELHGGGLICLGGEPCRLMGRSSAMMTGLRTYSPDYRMPPDHPYPAALDDCTDAYRWLLDRYAPERIVISGASAGANLAAALTLRARDEGLPMPAGVVLRTPEVDLTESGDTYETLLGLDTVLPNRLIEANLLYAAGEPLTSPYISPLFGDFTKGFPRTFLQSGTRDLFLSSTVLMHRALRRAGIVAELHIWEGMPHGGFGGAPEDTEMGAEVRRFVKECISA